MKNRRIEFGSDFDMCCFPIKEDLINIFAGMNMYASGRQALQHLIESMSSRLGWKRLWVPAYYCGESLEYIKGIEIKRYSILPDEVPCFEKLNAVCNFEVGDVLMLVNFFGIHNKIDVSGWGITVVEDHTHDLQGDWALNSMADWCFASIRKSLPVADGGVLWSPRRMLLPCGFKTNINSPYNEIADKRNEAMRLKSRYLKGENVAKNDFLVRFAETEKAFASLPVSAPCLATILTTMQIDLTEWLCIKERNLKYIKGLLNLKSCEILESASFSLLLKFATKKERDEARMELIANSVYAAILWPDIYELEENAPEKEWGDCMLSLHVDGRYTLEDMEFLARILNRLL